MDSRRGVLAGIGAGVAGGLGMSACGDSSAKPSDKAIVILVPGSQHGSFCWARVLPFLVEGGVTPLAVDMPGTGLGGRFPVSGFARPFDAAAYAAEPSPVAGITLADFEAHVGGIVDRLHAAGRGPIHLVGHSLGGLTLNVLGQSRAARLASLMYLSAILPAPGQSLLDTLLYPEAGQSFVLQGLAGSVGQPNIGASRMDLASPDSAYRAQVKSAYCADASDDDLLAWLNQLVPDDPEAVLAQSIALTAAGYGRLPRTYVRCTEDRIVPPAWSDRMIAAMDASQTAAGRRTVVRDLPSSHSPFLSKPSELANLILQHVASVTA